MQHIQFIIKVLIFQSCRIAHRLQICASRGWFFVAGRYPICYL